MSSLASTYTHISNILSFEFCDSELESKLSQPNFNWDAIVIEGSKHLMLPAIYCRLKSKTLLHVLPKELELYLEELATINRNRNKSILRQIYTISSLLNEHQIEHVFLKGTALLVSENYGDISERMIGDIDILVEKPKLNFAFNLIKENGYNDTYGYAYETIDHRHLDRLISKNELAAIELHSELLNKKYRNLINIDALLKTKVQKNGIYIPKNTYINLHQILSWQINDKGHYYKAVNFKSLYDSIVLKASKDKELIESLLKHKFGKSYIAIAKIYFKEFHHLSLNKKIKYYAINHSLSARYKGLRIVLKSLKQTYFFIYSRISLFFYNKNYRVHVIKKIFINN